MCASFVTLGVILFLFLFLPSAIDCGRLSAPDNGGIVDSGTDYGSTARYTCDAGYRLVGDVFRLCQSSGSWSGSMPTCQCMKQYLVVPLSPWTVDQLHWFHMQCFICCCTRTTVDKIALSTCCAGNIYSGIRFLYIPAARKKGMLAPVRCMTYSLLTNCLAGHSFSSDGCANG